MQRIKNSLKILEDKGQLRKIPSIKTKSDNYITINEKVYVNLASNDYLNISTNRVLYNEFLSANHSLPSSASARLLSGSSQEYFDLERSIANLFNKEACLLFNTGYQCNLGVISTLCEKGDVIFSDKLNHASIIDGMKLADGDYIRYKHLDYGNLENLLKDKRNKYNRAIIISESVFSMDGDVVDLDKLIELKNKYDCLLMIDEAHGFCTYSSSFAGITVNKDVDIITGTFGKALGSYGAFCVSNVDIINYLINKARSFIFSTSLPPISVAWTNWLLNEKQEFLITQKEKLNKITSQTLRIFNNTTSKTHIIPVIIGSNYDTLKIAECLKAAGYYIPAVRPPTVPEGSSRLRISLTSNTKLSDIEKIAKIVHEFSF